MIRSVFIKRYWKVGKLLHIVAFLAFFFSVYSFTVIQELDFNSNIFSFLTWLAIFICFFNMSILAELDAYSRYQNYKQIKDQIYFNGYQHRLVKPLSKSSCQRSAAILAGSELGCENDISAYFYKCGYRWYHIIPDFVFSNPLLFFTVFFWRTTFFAPNYQPKINYNNLVLSGNE